ncbi:MAG TPA: IS4 family transposase, partial [Candidatus Elarobacter sp.]|nr:IS4 family transposase [Candidatus Elarobacter sp.]
IKPVPVDGLNAENGLDGAGWAEQEFGACELGDHRLTERLVKIVLAQAAQPHGSYSQAIAGQRHELKAYYRFLNNERSELNLESLLQCHRSQTIRRMKNEETVLIVQDTTDLNLSTRRHCEGLGQIGTNQTGTKSRGLRLHTSLGLSGEGLPLGLVQLHGYAPQSATDKDPDRPIEQKDSFRWLGGLAQASAIAALLPKTRIISVADREADMFELFDFRRRQKGPKAELLIRAKSNRCLEATEHKLFEELAATPLAQTVRIQVPRQREKASLPSTPGRPAFPAREAQVEIRFKAVTLSAPNTMQTRHHQPITVWAVYLLEKNPPPGATRLEWMLLTTMQVASVKQALQCIQWYCRRWRIEEWHRVLKSGCNILDHQNHSAQALLRAISIDAVIAWRIMLLALLGRETPELPCAVLFDPCECEVLQLLSKKSLSLPRRSHDYHCPTGRIPRPQMRWRPRIPDFMEGLHPLLRHGQNHETPPASNIKK